MRIFDYDRFTKEDKRRSMFAELCKNHRVTGSKKDGKVVGNNGSTFTSDENWESEVPDFMVGDRVVIKTWEQMKTEYGVDCGRDIKAKLYFTENMRNLCGKKATITRKDEEQIWLTFDDINADNGWTFSTDMIELAYPTVRGNDKEKRVETSKVTYTSNTVEYNGQKATCQSGDRFDLEKGIMLCLLKEVGVGYRYIQELAKTAERKISHKFNTGDVVKVVNSGEQYKTYFAWFDEQKKPELGKRYCDKFLFNGKELRVVHFGEHSYFTDIIIYACEDLKGNIYLIGERGLEKVED